MLAADRSGCPSPKPGAIPVLSRSYALQEARLNGDLLQKMAIRLCLEIGLARSDISAIRGEDARKAHSIEIVMSLIRSPESGASGHKSTTVDAEDRQAQLESAVPNCAQRRLFLGVSARGQAAVLGLHGIHEQRDVLARARNREEHAQVQQHQADCVHVD